ARSSGAVAWQARGQKKWFGSNWPLGERFDSDGKSVSLFSTYVIGEKYTGEMVSDPFDCPDKMVLRVAGHHGKPSHVPLVQNRVDLIDFESREVLRTALVPRNDVVQTIPWQLGTFEGKRVQLRAVDEDRSGAFAWMAFKVVSPATLSDLSVVRALNAAIHAAEDLGLVSLSDDLFSLSNDSRVSMTMRRRAGIAGSLLNGELSDAIVLQVLSEMGEFGDLDIKSASERGHWFRTLEDDVASHLVWLWLTKGASRDELLNHLVKGNLPLSAIRNSKCVDWLQSQSGDAGLDRLKAIADYDASPIIEEKLQNALRQYQNVQSSALGLGAAVFQERCANCHQLGGKGKMVGPQLDGVVVRRPERLMQDILMPNLHVDAAFVTSTLLLDDGSILTGWVVRKDDEKLWYRDQAGLEKSVWVDELILSKKNQQSLMPSNFHEALSGEELVGVVAYLRSQKP
ncbi:MAG: c-type cytochrome, partial [Planctomycetota bacterium]